VISENSSPFFSSSASTGSTGFTTFALGSSSSLSDPEEAACFFLGGAAFFG